MCDDDSWYCSFCESQGAPESKLKLVPSAGVWLCEVCRYEWPDVDGDPSEKVCYRISPACHNCGEILQHGFVKTLGHDSTKVALAATCGSWVTHDEYADLPWDELEAVATRRCVSHDAPLDIGPRSRISPLGI